MKVYEASKKMKITNKEFCEEYGLKTHMSKLPTSLEAELFGEEKKIQTAEELTETIDSAETVVLGDGVPFKPLATVEEVSAKREKPPEKPVGPLVEAEVTQSTPDELPTHKGLEYTGECRHPTIPLSKQIIGDEVCHYTVAEIEIGIRCLGNKGKQWKWRHLL